MKENFASSFADKMANLASKMQDNIYFSSITHGMMGTMAIIMIGAVLQLIYSIPFVQNWSIYSLIGNVIDICNLLALYMVFTIGRELGKQKGVDGVQTGLISLLCLLIIIPITIQSDGSKLINTSYLGAMGIIASIIIALIVPTIFAYAVKRNWTIKLPESVPDFVSNSFKVIVPATVAVLPFIILKGLFAMTSYGDMVTFIYSVIQTPLQAVGNTLGGHIILMIFACVLWWCGMHGTLVVLPILTTVLMAPMLENIEAVNAGLAAPNLLSYMTFFIIIQFLGGPGNLLGLNFDLAFLTKSERYKAQGKVSIVPGIFNIIEPTVFGLPVVLNPVLFIPFVGVPVLNYLLLYFALKIGLFATPTVLLNIMVIPGPIAGFLLGGGVGLGIFCILACVLSGLIYYPFVKILDKQALKLESEKQKIQGEKA